MANISGSDANFMTIIAGPDAGDTDQLMGFAFGGFFTYNFSPTFALQPEFLYTMKGFSVPVLGVDIDFKMDYIEIPVLFKFQFGTGTAKPCLFAGPAVAFMVSAKLEVLGESVDADELWKSTDLGLVFGGGIDFPVGSGMVTFDGRYTMGMSKIPDAGGEIDIKNANISFLVGYGL